MIKSRKSLTLAYGVYDIVHANGKQERKVMTVQQRKGLSKSKAWKNVLSCDCICKLDVTIKLKF